MVDNKKISRKEKKKIKESAKLSVKEGSFAGVMSGFGDNYITPYALALGATNIIIALISTMPGLIGNLNKLYALDLMKKKSRKQIVFLSILGQSLGWIPIIITGILYLYFEQLRVFVPFILLFAYGFMIISGATCTPAWNSWMKDLIRSHNGSYFGSRNRIINIVTIFSMFFASLILNLFSDDKVLFGFFIIFFIAMIGRLISLYYLKK